MPELSWFTGAGLGLFVHWDHASQQGIEISWPLVGPEILPVVPGTPALLGPADVVTIEQYQSSAATFDPVRWDPEALARLARSCGVRYVVFTARHHAGYSMFHTAHSRFSVEHSPYGRDILADLVRAVRAEGLRVGLYYSLSDWNHPDYPRFEESDKPYDHFEHRRASAAAWSRYVGYLEGQLTELLTNYGPIDLVWFDGGWERTAEEWHAEELRALVRRLQPDAIVNDRLPGQGDYVTPEQALPPTPPSGPWEMCLTMSSGWGWRPHDTRYKSARRLAQDLAEVTSRGGNLLLNVSPTGDGSLPEPQVERLRDLGTWLESHGESVLGVVPPPASVHFYGPATMTPSGTTLYLHLIARPVEPLVVRGVPIRHIRDVTLLASGAALAYESTTEVFLALPEHDDASVLGELRIALPASTEALHDVVAIDLDQSIASS
jgi:alpha-L-fucosidase